MTDQKQPLRFFAADLDGTLLGQMEALTRFKVLWAQLEPSDRPILCYNTGRMLPETLQLITDEQIPQPDYIIAGVGTSIYDVSEQVVLKEFTEVLEDGWDLKTVEAVMRDLPYDVTLQPEHYQNAYKSSWFFNDAEASQIKRIRRHLDKAGLVTHVVYSSSRHLDVLPRWANKGNALRWLLSHLDIPGTAVLVAGDSGNDSAMFGLDGVRGIIVGNAQPELYEAVQDVPVYQAPPHEVCGYGVISGLRHFGVFSPEQSAEETRLEEHVLYESVRHSGEEALTVLTQEQHSFIRQGYHKAIEALKKNITPLGFTACSLNDNESIGTDVNYRSVWARDGSITLIGSLPLIDQDDDIRECQRQTLVTLLNHIGPNGQIPANVRIDDERPDYSGVGGIASIDSGLWLIIAFYSFVRKTRDHAFLRERLDDLQGVMDWLGAQDSNNDALLEIPEAGDWTDLFGRSYNVLYDEVLWYRCNVCFGRLLQMMGEEHRAGDYLRWASVIKREILANFWPSTQQQIYQTVSFAEQQYSIGDARYLIAQITPFDFSWRCDTFGNVLAFLYDVVDARRAAQTFRFLWGVGVNEPFPIINLYPAVTVGDKDWRPYYAVNLLNLPSHYHNGGIWPFIGGHWVRFVNKLGLRELALQELYRLTELNKLGVLNEWEFNEWAHGRTGRPMGKAFQAWSASEFILACHALNIVA